MGVGETRTMLFGFSRASLQFAVDDEEILFTTRLEAFPVKAAFNLKEMLYRGAVAV
jgi:hypothetical protein